MSNRMSDSINNNQKPSKEEIALTSSELPSSTDNPGDFPKENQTKYVHIHPNGGFQAWLVAFCSFLCNGIIFGTINSFGILYVFLKERFENEDDSASTKASSIGSITVGATFLLSAFAGILADRYGIRRTACIGGLIATLGLIISSFVVDKFEALCFAYGILFGCGSALAYTPSLAILGHYFDTKIGVVNGLVTAGSSLFTIAMPHVLTALLSSIGLENTLRVLAALTSVLMLASLSFKPLIKRKEMKTDQGILSQLVNVENWKHRRYVQWTLIVPIALFGYFVPYIHVVQFSKDVMPGENGETLVTCIAITSGIGRIVFGKVADIKFINRIYLQAVAFGSIGLATMMLPVAGASGNFTSLIAITLIMGLFDGCFISLLGPIAIDIVGSEGASQALGFLLTMCSIPLTVGPPVAGYIYDYTKSYDAAFLMAGVPPIAGGSLLFLLELRERIKARKAKKEDIGSVEAQGLTKGTSQPKVLDEPANSVECTSLLS